MAGASKDGNISPDPPSSPEPELVEPSLRVTEGELAGTIPFSPEADAAAQMSRKAQANPVVERGPPKQQKKKRKPPPPPPPPRFTPDK